MSEFEPNTRDRFIVETAIRMLVKLQKSDIPSPAERISIAKLGMILSKFPRCDFDDYIDLWLHGPRRIFGDHKISHSWHIAYEEGLLSISTGGVFRREGTGSDSFTCLDWSISNEQPGDFNDYSAHHRIVDDLKPFHLEVEEMDLTDGEWKIELIDEANEYLSGGEENEEDYGEDALLSISIPTPNSPAERALTALIDVERAIEEANCVSEPWHGCDICNTPSARLNHLIDGAYSGGAWAWMCPDCWAQHGLGMGVGKGQLFTKQPDGNWVWTAGFPKHSTEDE